MSETIANRVNAKLDLIDNEYTFDMDGEFSIAFCGDMHLHASGFRSRSDDYPETTLNKLAILRAQLLSRGIKYLFIGGDIFHTPKEPTTYEYRVINEFLKFKEAGITVFSITGNHDLSNERLENIEKSSLGILFLTRTINSFSKVTFNRKDKVPIVITGCNFPNQPAPPDDKSAYNICIVHKFYDNSFAPQESLTVKDFELLGYNMYGMGHDHMPYDLTKVPTTRGVVSVVRPGSFMRATSHNYNTNRLVYIDEIRFVSKIEVVRHTLPVRPPEEVFPASVMTKDDTINLDRISRELKDLVSQIYNDSNIKGTSVYEVLDSSPIEKVIKDRITSYLELHGIYRNNIVSD